MTCCLSSFGNRSKYDADFGDSVGSDAVDMMAVYLLNFCTPRRCGISVKLSNCRVVEMNVGEKILLSPELIKIHVAFDKRK